MSPKATRSPNSPSRSLGSCFDDAMKLYETFPNAFFDQVQIANRLGMSSTSGAFNSLLSDLKQYGLIARSAGGDFAVSPAVKEFSVADDFGKTAIKYSFATNPKVFMQIIENQGFHLPDVNTLANVLVARFDFNKAKASKTAKALWESLEWANSIDEKGNVLKPSNENRPDALRETVHEEGPVDIKGIEDSKSSKLDSGLLSADVPLGDGRIARVEYPSDLTSDEAKKIGVVLSALAN